MMIVQCKYDELVPREKLKAHPKNRNKHPEAQIARLAQILKYQGWRYPVKVSKRSGYVTSGHGRIEAAWLNGWKEVPVNYQDYEDEAQEYADVTADNAIASWAELDLSGINTDLANLGPDFDLDLLGIKDFTLDVADKEGLTDPDDTPDVKLGATVCQPGDLWLLGEHRLLCGDSTKREDVERLMNGEKADMVFTDPPYGLDFISKSGVLSQNYKQYAGEENQDTYLNAFEVWKEIAAQQIWWGGNFVAHALPKSTYWISWNKQGDNMKAGGPATDQTDCEIAWTNLKFMKIKQYQHVWAGWFRAGNRLDELKTTVHPSQKPVALFEYIFNDHPALSVADPFLGSGSTLIACEKTNRKCYGMEIDPHYCDVILERWAKFTGKEPVCEDGKKWSELHGQTEKTNRR